MGTTGNTASVGCYHPELGEAARGLVSRIRRVWQTSPAFSDDLPQGTKQPCREGAWVSSCSTLLPPLIFTLPLTFPSVSYQGPHYPNPPRSQVAKRLPDEGETSQPLLQRQAEERKRADLQRKVRSIHPLWEVIMLFHNCLLLLVHL